MADEMSFYAVRCVFHDDRDRAGGPQGLAPGEHAYEERITLWRATSADEAIVLADKEAEKYASSVGCEYTGLAQSYWLEEDPRRQGSVAFSLVRKSLLEPDVYVDTFFDTGLELEEDIEE